MELAKNVYKMLEDLPRYEDYGLISQMRRSVVSIPSNIAEGTSRTSPKEFVYFLQVALGSCFELETQVLLAKDLGYISEDKKQKVITDIITQQRKIVGFIRRIKQEH